MEAAVFKTKTTGNLPAIHAVFLVTINDIECVHIITRMFVDNNDENAKVIRKYFGKYYIQREMIYKLSTFELINNAVLFLKNGEYDTKTIR